MFWKSHCVSKDIKTKQSPIRSSSPLHCGPTLCPSWSLTWPGRLMGWQSYHKKAKWTIQSSLVAGWSRWQTCNKARRGTFTKTDTAVLIHMVTVCSIGNQMQSLTSSSQVICLHLLVTSSAENWGCCSEIPDESCYIKFRENTFYYLLQIILPFFLSAWFIDLWI